MGHNSSGFAAEHNLLSLEVCNPDLLRGVDAAVVLSGGTHYFSEGLGRRSWRLSYPVRSLDDFVLHSSQSQSWKRALGLYLGWNGSAAIYAGYIVATFAFVLQAFAVLPPMGTYISGTRKANLPAGAWCTVLGLSVYLFVFRYWQCLQQCILRVSRCVFLDTLCICQYDSELKREGILMLGAFIANSRRIVILSDETIFSQLWSILQIAAFAYAGGTMPYSRGAVTFSAPLTFSSGSEASRPSAQESAEPQELDGTNTLFVPIELATMLAGITASMWVVVGIVYVCFFTPSDEGTSLELLYGGITFGLLIFSPIWVFSSRGYVRDRRNLDLSMSRFRFAAASCLLPDDRELIRASIKSWFGAIEHFEKFVQEVLRGELSHNAGTTTTIPYWYTLLLGFPWLCVHLDLLATKTPMIYGYSRYIARALIGVNHAFLMPALWMKLFLAVVQLFTSLRFCEASFSFGTNYMLGSLLAFLGILLAIAILGIPAVVELHWKLPGMLCITLLYIALVACLYFIENLRWRSSQRKCQRQTVELGIFGSLF